MKGLIYAPFVEMVSSRFKLKAEILTGVEAVAIWCRSRRPLRKLSVFIIHPAIIERARQTPYCRSMSLIGSLPVGGSP